MNHENQQNYKIEKKKSSNLCYYARKRKKKYLKVSKSQKQFFLKFHCPKNEGNIRQNSAL